LLAGALEEVYAAVDAAIATVLAALPPGSDVIVTSAVGMDVNTSRADLLPQMLAAVLAGGATSNGDAGSIWRLRAALPPGLRGAAMRALPAPLALEATARLELRGLDWSRTRAFAHPADNQGYVRLNLRGRERQGIVDPSEAGALCEEIEEGLRDFHDPDGEPAVAGLSRVRERYVGPYAERLPDLVVRWRPTAATNLRGLHSPRFGAVSRLGAGSGRSGNHTEDGAWALVVPGASRHRAPSRPPRLVDVAATVCELSGVEAAGLPGEPLLAR
jgi:predicted AlkP superfamily phosphohydrolase/phosphomutase